MAKLERDRDTKRREGDLFVFEAAERIFGGALVSLNSGGKAVSATAGTVVVGVAWNAAQAGEELRVRRGVFAFDNDAAAPLSRADVGSLAIVVDDHTVARAGDASSPAAGLVLNVDDDGVWIRI